MSGVGMIGPPSSIRDAIERQVKIEAGRSLKPGENGAFVSVIDTSGANVAVVVRGPHGVEIQGWFGKKWSGDVAVQARVIHTW